MEGLLTVTNPCSWDKVESRYRPIVDEAVRVYRETPGTPVLEIRLMGSVARGDARAPFSDIDFIALLAEDPTVSQRAAVTERAAELTARFDCVSKVDLEAVSLASLGEARCFILNSDSLHLWGEDLFTLREQRVSGAKLAGLLTPDLPSILCRYQESVRNLADDDRAMLVQWSRWSGKDILKCLRKHALLGGGAYERTIEGIRDQLPAYLSEHTPLIDDLYELYARPEPDRKRILSVLARAEAELPGP